MQMQAGYAGGCPTVQSVVSQINRTINELLSEPVEVPQRLREAMFHSVLAGGKRLRPVMFLGAAVAVGWEEWWRLSVPACALEMIHAYSLVHDDLPSMDNDDTRRGLPTCHRKFGEATAILTGDALLTMAFECLARPVEGVSADTQNAAIVEVSRASGREGLVGGQYDDLAIAGVISDPDAAPDPSFTERLMDVNRRKTGALFRAAVVSGAMFGGGGPLHVDKLKTYAEHFGLAFQMADDIHDGGPLIRKMGPEWAAEFVKKAIKEANDALLPFGDQNKLLLEVSNIILASIGVDTV